MLEENYPMALKNFLDAYREDSSGSNINYKIGLCYLHSASQKKKAESYFEKSVLKISKSYDDIEPSETSAPPEAYYYLAKAQHLSYKFDEAIANFEKYKTYIPAKKIERIKDVDHQIEICKNGKEFVSNPTKVVITNLGDTVNSPSPDYSAVISADESVLIFTSRREGSTGGLRTVSNEFYEDIYISHKKPDGTWSGPVSIDENINTTGNEASVGLSADGQQLFIYKDDNGDGNIYYCNLEGDRWSTPIKLGSDINSKFWEPHACVSADGNTLYFVSDRPGGYGGRDIYKCVKLPNGQWSLAKNLGPTVNTEYDEDAVFIHPDQVTLFFSSNGHKTMGGFDIFFTSASEDGKWSEPTNVGYPINTTDDDIYYVVSTDGKRAYFSSAREGGLGEKDIYLVSLEESVKVQPVALLVGKIIVDEGEKLPESNEIIVTNQESGQSGSYKANTKTGKYVLSLTPGKTYEISYRADDKEFYKEVFTVPLGTDFQEIDREVPLKPVVLSTKTPAAGSADVKTDKNPVSEKKTILMAGNLFADGNFSKPLINTKVILLNEKGEVVQTTTTNNHGKFVFSDLPADKGYSMSFEENDPQLVNLNKITLTDNKGNVIKEVTRAKKFKFELLSSEQLKLGKIYEDDAFFQKKVLADKTKEKKNEPVEENAAAPDGLYYELFFKYNVYEIDPQNELFSKFINDVKTYIDSKGKINLTIESSASHVPTRTFKTNDNLAMHRADEAKAKILASLKSKGVEESKVIFKKTKNIVHGPEYKHDFEVNKATYEKYQYVKVRFSK